MLKTLLCFSLFIHLTAVRADVKDDALKLWQNRDQQQSLEGALGKFEEALKIHPQDFDALTYLARGYFIKAEFFMTSEKDKKANFEKAKTFGEAALRINPEYKKHEKTNIEKAIDSLTVNEVAPLYWTAASIGKWARLEGVFKSLGYKNQILYSIKRVEKLKPDFFHGAVPRYWGGYYAVAPGIAGGDMEKSKENFMKAIQMAPECLANKTLYAELYLVKKGGEEEFKKVLKEVLQASDGPSELAPDNRLEKMKAQKLLGQIGDLF